MKIFLGLVITTLMTQFANAQERALFQLEDLYNEASEKDLTYLRFIDNEKLSSGIYQLKAGVTDEQEPHKWDELYYVLEGRAKLNVEGEQFEVVPGGILFVAADAVHQFVEIEDDLKLLVFFSKKE